MEYRIIWKVNAKYHNLSIPASKMPRFAQSYVACNNVMLWVCLNDVLVTLIQLQGQFDTCHFSVNKKYSESFYPMTCLPRYS